MKSPGWLVGQVLLLAFQEMLVVKNLPANAGDIRDRLDSWVRKIPWKRKWQPTPVFLPGVSHGQRSLAGYSPWGCYDLETKKRYGTKSFYLNLFKLFIKIEKEYVKAVYSHPAYLTSMQSTS